MNTFDAAQARLLGQTVAAVYEDAAARFGLSESDIAKAAIGAAIGAAVRGGLSQADVLDLVRSYWPRVTASGRA